MSERPLPKDAWAKFAPDGVLFESLAFDLLKSMYPQHEFRRTQRTHDYGRDAEACIAVDNATRIRRLTVSNGSMLGVLTSCSWCSGTPCIESLGGQPKASWHYDRVAIYE